MKWYMTGLGFTIDAIIILSALGTLIMWASLLIIANSFSRFVQALERKWSHERESAQIHSDAGRFEAPFKR